MKIQIIHVSAGEKPYWRGLDVQGRALEHTRERPYLLVAGQELPAEIREKLLKDYPGTERTVAATVINTLNMKPTPLHAILEEIEIGEKKAEGGKRKG